MRRYLVSFTIIAALLFIGSNPVLAQDKDKDKDKSKLNDNEELIIKKKGDKDGKVTIEIKGDEITVNGKPLEDFDDENIEIRKGRGNGFALIAPRSPFRGSGAWSYSGDIFDENGAFLGVATEKSDKGAKVEQVTRNSAAEKAGLKTGDIITKVDDTKIETPDDLTKVIRKHKSDDKVSITYERDGKTANTTATLLKRKSGMTYSMGPDGRFQMPDMNFEWHGNEFPGNGFPGDGFGNGFAHVNKPRLGIKAQDTEEGKGAKVLEVGDESAAEKAGVKENDVIVNFDGKKIDNTDDLAKAAREARDKQSVKITVLRNGKTETLEVKTPRKLKTADL